MSGELKDHFHQVEYVDTDAVGGMHFTRYASLLETAVTTNLEALGVNDHLTDAKLAFAELRMKYVATARVRDPLTIRVRVEHVGGASCRVSGEVRHATTDVLFATGLVVVCLVGLADDTPIPLPASFRASLRACADHG